MIKYKLHATIGLPNYSNLQPEVELEGENLDELHATAMAHIEKVWANYGTPPETRKIEIGAPENGLNARATFKTTSYTGETVYYDEVAHKYYSEDGTELLSGSAYADSMVPKFDKENVLPKTAKAWGIDPQDLEEIWKLSGQVSTEYGTAIHRALETWIRFGHLGEKIKDAKKLEENYVLPKNRHMRDVVLAFAEKFGAITGVPEVLITDIKNKRAGRVDLLEILNEEKKEVRVCDYKTNTELDSKKLTKYAHQLSFYSEILAQHGYSVLAPHIYHYDGSSWNIIELELIPVK